MSNVQTHHHRFRVLGVVGLLIIVISAILGAVQPRAMGRLPAGMHTPVIAFELARSRDEVETMFGDVGSQERAEWRAGMTTGTRVDFAFLVSYGAFLAGMGAILVSGRARLVAVFLPLVAAVFDAAENLQLLSILGSLGGRYDGALAALSIFTWCKWLGLAAYFAVIAPAAWKVGGVFRIAALAGSIVTVSTVSAFFVRGVSAEVMGAGVGVAVLLLFVGALGGTRAVS